MKLAEIIKADDEMRAALVAETAKINGLEIEVADLKAAQDNLTSASERDIEAIKLASKAYKDAAKTLEIAKDNLAKQAEKHRRDMLEKIGCKPDNHPVNHTAMQHIIIKDDMMALALASNERYLRGNQQ